jgi:hypothetical protein
MDTVVKVSAFNKELKGQAVVIRGLDTGAQMWNDKFIVSRVDIDSIHLTGKGDYGKVLGLENFEGGHLTMTVLEEKEERKGINGKELYEVFQFLSAKTQPSIDMEKIKDMTAEDVLDLVEEISDWDKK